MPSRIELLGIWADLEMPSGYAYAKILRTVKTCVGQQYCRFGTADSMSMGIRLEKRLERLNTPEKVKMAVSACPRNCAESSTSKTFSMMLKPVNNYARDWTLLYPSIRTLGKKS
jgi:NAD(P)H-nitrite reductase large subunit